MSNVKKFALIYILLLFLSSLLISFPKINIVRASGTIYIRADGTVEGTDNIQRDGNVYTFTGNIYDSIVVERDNIVIDGADYTLQGTGSGNGINLVDRSNVTVKNMQIMYFYNGIDRPKSNNAFYANYIANNVNGIWGGVSNNTIIGNTITDNTENGISLLFGANHNTISGNKITNNWVGIYYWLSGHDLISENNITANGFGIQVNAGGENIIIKNNITNNGEGIRFLSSTNNIIYHNNFINNTVQAYTDRSNGTWENGSEGNYWDDYAGVDNDGDGVGDTPYVIDENNQDNFPLVSHWTPYTQHSEPFPTTWIAAATAIVALVGVALMIYFTKVIRRKVDKTK